MQCELAQFTLATKTIHKSISYLKYDVKRQRHFFAVPRYDSLWLFSAIGAWI